MRQSTVTALFKLSDTRTFERYLVVSALVAELTTVAMSKLTDRLAVWDEDPDSFDDFAAQCALVQRRLEKVRTETGDSACGATVRCERWKDVEPDPEIG